MAVQLKPKARVKSPRDDRRSDGASPALEGQGGYGGASVRLTSGGRGGTRSVGQVGVLVSCEARAPRGVGGAHLAQTSEWTHRPRLF